MNHSGPIRNPQHSHACFVFGQGSPADWPLPGLRFRGYQRSWPVAKTASHMDGYSESFGKLDGAIVHHGCTGAGQLEHLVVADPGQLPSFRNDPRIGGVYPVHICIDLAEVGLKCCCQSHSCCVTTSPTQGRDVKAGIHALETGRDDNLALLKQLTDSFRRNGPYSCLSESTVGENAKLWSGKTDGVIAEELIAIAIRDHAYLLAGGQEHVQLAGRRLVGDLLGKGD